MGVFIVSNRNIVIPSPDGRERVSLARGYMGLVPDWAAETDYFKALVSDGKLTVSASKADRALEKEQKRAEKARKAAEEKARKAAEEKARKAAEEKARKAAEEKAPESGPETETASEPGHREGE